MVTKTAPAVLTTSSGIEYVVAEAPSSLIEAIAVTYPGLAEAEDVVLVPMALHASVDLNANAAEADEKAEEARAEEKDRLVQEFEKFAVSVTGLLSTAGHWCDYFNAERSPVMHKTNDAPFPLPHTLADLLGFKVGLGTKLNHPKWGGAVYASAIIARGPVADVAEAVREADGLAQAAAADAE